MPEELKQAILNKIKSGAIHKKSRANFVAQSTLLIVGLIISFLLAIYVTSFVAYVLDNNGTFLFNGLGVSGIKIAFLTLPWILLLFVGLLIIAFEFFGKRYKFMYKQPFIVSGLLVLFIVIIGGVALGQTTLHSRIEEAIESRDIFIMNSLYKRYGKVAHKDAYMGIVETIKESNLIINSLNGGHYEVIISKNTHFPTGNSFNIGERVLIVGRYDDGNIYAEGIRLLRGDEIPRFRHGTSTLDHKPIWMK